MGLLDEARRVTEIFLRRVVQTVAGDSYEINDAPRNLHLHAEKSYPGSFFFRPHLEASKQGNLCCFGALGGEF